MHCSTVMQECNAQLEVVEKGLNQFLETKKMAFPRYAHAAAVRTSSTLLLPYNCEHRQLVGILLDRLHACRTMSAPARTAAQ